MSGRLEAATSRLEDIASSTELPKDVPGLGQPATPLSETAVAPTPPPVQQEPPQEALPESVEDFDAFLNTSVDKYVKLSSQLGGVVAQQVHISVLTSIFPGYELGELTVVLLRRPLRSSRGSRSSASFCSSPLRLRSRLPQVLA